MSLWNVKNPGNYKTQLADTIETVHMRPRLANALIVSVHPSVPTAMVNCDKCHTQSARWVRFEACNHAICPPCLADIIWDGRDGGLHFLCCLEPWCPICAEVTNIVVESDSGTSRVHYEIPVDGKKSGTH